MVRVTVRVTWALDARSFLPMKKYRCIFKYVNGSTTMSVEAHDAQSALDAAQDTVMDTAKDIEVWDGASLVLRRHAAAKGFAEKEGS
jgi:hypothetical protein